MSTPDDPLPSDLRAVIAQEARFISADSRDVYGVSTIGPLEAAAIVERIARLAWEARGRAEGWQPIDTLKDYDRVVPMGTPRERLYTREQLQRFPDLPEWEQRVITKRCWTWATHWKPLPPAPTSDEPAQDRTWFLVSDEQEPSR